MLLGSTSKNINILTVATAGLVVVYGLFNPILFSISNIILSIISFYVLNILGIWMTLHRYYSHKSFEFKNPYIKWAFTFLAIVAGRGSPLGWVYLHRRHHAYSDTEKDPHSPKFLGYKLFGFGHYQKQEEEKMQLFLVKDMMSKEQLFIHKWYIVIITIFILLLASVDFELCYFGWAIPAFLIQLSQNNFNYIGHMYGYKNFTTEDDSRNNAWLFPILLGEAWHNNHHHSPKDYTTRVNSYEIDPVSNIIDLVKK